MVKVKTVYTEKMLKQYYSLLSTLTFKLRRLIFIIIAIVLFIIGTFINHKSVLLDISFLVILYIIFEVSIRIYLGRKFIKNNQELINYEISYSLQEDQLHIVSKKTDEIIRYAHLYRVIEMEECIYLFTDKYNAYIVDKSGISKKDNEIIVGNFKNNKVKYQFKFNRYV